MTGLPSFMPDAIQMPLSSFFKSLTPVKPAFSIRSFAWFSVKLLAPPTGAVGFFVSGVATAGVLPSAVGAGAVVWASAGNADAPISAAAKMIFLIGPGSEVDVLDVDGLRLVCKVPRRHTRPSRGACCRSNQESQVSV